MTGQEMVYVVLKGRILKSDLKVEVFEPMSSWQQSIENFTKNGNIIYFLMPPFPLPQFDTIKTEIIIYYKDEEFHRTTYLYKGSLDRMYLDFLKRLFHNGLFSTSFFRGISCTSSE